MACWTHFISAIVGGMIVLTIITTWNLVPFEKEANREVTKEEYSADKPLVDSRLMGSQVFFIGDFLLQMHKSIKLQTYEKYKGSTTSYLSKESSRIISVLNGDSIAVTIDWGDKLRHDSDFTISNLTFHLHRRHSAIRANSRVFFLKNINVKTDLYDLDLQPMLKPNFPWHYLSSPLGTPLDCGDVETVPLAYKGEEMVRLTFPGLRLQAFDLKEPLFGQGNGCYYEPSMELLGCVALGFGWIFVAVLVVYRICRKSCKRKSRYQDLE